MAKKFWAALDKRIWKNVAESPRTAPANAAKLCTYHRGFSPPGRLHFAPYHHFAHANHQVAGVASVQDGVPCLAN